MVNMTAGDMVLKVMFLLQVGAGVLGNAYLFFIHSSVSLTGHVLKPINLILSKLAVANAFVLFSKGTQQMMEDLGQAHGLEDPGCQVFYYFHRVSREFLLCATSLLSCFQAVTVSPRGWMWEALRVRVSKNVGSSCLLCWTLNLAINAISPINLRVSWENRSDSWTGKSFVCQWVPSKFGMFSIPLSFLGAFLMILLVGASVHMVCLLYQHRQRVRHVHSPSLTHRTSPEMRATQRILLLVALFIPFYFLNSLYIFYEAKSFSSYTWLQNALKFLATSFPSLSPLVLIFQKFRALGSCL